MFWSQQVLGFHTGHLIWLSVWGEPTLVPLGYIKDMWTLVRAASSNGSFFLGAPRIRA